MYYCGIGSRSTPPEILEEMRKIGRYFAKKGLILRSGGAKGADSAFEEGCDEVNGKKEIFYSKDSDLASRAIASKYLLHWDRYTPYVQGLFARNVKIILGNDLSCPADFVVCWTPKGDVVGGTGHSLKIAIDSRIPTYNLALWQDREALHNLFLEVS